MSGGGEGSSVADLLAAARLRFADGGVASPELDARLLVAEAFGVDAARLFLAKELPAAAAGRDRLAGFVARRLAGEPVHRILGRRAFYAHDFQLSPDTLEPRPDTEALVDLARAPITECIGHKGRCIVADIGTGTGAIAVSLLALFPEAEAVATDISAGALATAAANAGAAGVAARFRVRLGDHLLALDRPVDVIVSNPPYIPSGDIAALQREVREHDPLRALDGGPDGLRSYRAIANGGRDALLPGGAVAVEIGIGQERDVAAIFAEQGFALETSARDLGGTERALLFRPMGDKEFP
ncbi:peptide chain release factor N(5)-glutamine methyltransferase [Aureimonas leprariae]|uniref:Release factor glutamine methyltransferase n=1 Tax=Plantimonas leprariae TaxID=2615207 RepID=A0A7V7PLB0_9HYPH|nr:peptide chain release factor N(5)-glutamine methyltransferase [Aureimonas leprariae]KAB0677077.1 peptide chain release factor N(5)-glutamine methyltransferase [Aureimonas leprariae]